MAKLITPYGGKLINLNVVEEELQAQLEYANTLPSIQLSNRSLCDLDLLATGAFSPLEQFMGEADYKRVLKEMRLQDGTFWPIPITLPVAPASEISIGKSLALRTAKNDLVGMIQVDEIFEWDLETEARSVVGGYDLRHPLTSEMSSWDKMYVSGPLKVFKQTKFSNFAEFRLFPAEMRYVLEKCDAENVVVYPPQTLIHRAHEALSKQESKASQGVLLIQAVLGLQNQGDILDHHRVRSYKALLQNYYDSGRTFLNVLPLATRMSGMREILWQAIIHRNYGASHIIFDATHFKSAEQWTTDQSFSQGEVEAVENTIRDETGVQTTCFGEVVCLPVEERYEVRRREPVVLESDAVRLSEEKMCEVFLSNGKPFPEWFTRPQTAEIMAEMYPPQHKQGFCLWFTGLSGAGKSATSEVLIALLLEYGRQVTLLDGDIVRTHLSKGLGFSREDRDANILRIGFVASEIVRHGGAIVCAAISPYRSTRSQCRNIVGADHFIEVFINTPLEVCERRDTKGLYAKARRGEIKGFTGIDDPYEAPLTPDLVLTTTDCSPEENAKKIILFLLNRKYLQGQK